MSFHGILQILLWMSVSIFDCMVLSEYTDGTSYKRGYAIPTVFSRMKAKKTGFQLNPLWDLSGIEHFKSVDSHQEQLSAVELTDR